MRVWKVGGEEDMHDRRRAKSQVPARVDHAKEHGNAIEASGRTRKTILLDSATLQRQS